MMSACRCGEFQREVFYKINSTIFQFTHSTGHVAPGGRPSGAASTPGTCFPGSVTRVTLV